MLAQHFLSVAWQASPPIYFVIHICISKLIRNLSSLQKRFPEQITLPLKHVFSIRTENNRKQLSIDKRNKRRKIGSLSIEPFLGIM